MQKEEGSSTTAKKNRRTPKYEHVWNPALEFDGKVYEPDGDSYLFLDALDADTEFLRRLNPAIVMEIGVGSGIVCSHCCLHALPFLPSSASSSSSACCCIGIDINRTALKATAETWRATKKVLLDEHQQQRQKSSNQQNPDDTNHPDEVVAAEKSKSPPPLPHRSLALIRGDLATAIRDNVVDVLLFNPPYVPTSKEEMVKAQCDALSSVDELPAAWAGGIAGREICDKVLVRIPSLLHYPRGVAYLVAIRENNVEDMLAIVNEAAAKMTGDGAGGSGGRKMSATVVIKRYTGEHLSIVRFGFVV